MDDAHNYLLFGVPDVPLTAKRSAPKKEMDEAFWVEAKGPPPGRVDSASKKVFLEKSEDEER